MERVFILGADDPEMREIERVLRDRNERIVHAVKDGERVHPGGAYNADAVLEPLDALRVLVECEPKDFTFVNWKRIDHHRPDDPGYGLGADRFWEASSLGQLCKMLKIEPTHEQLVLAAMDHCPANAIRGECPGVTAEEVLDLKISAMADAHDTCPDIVRELITEAMRRIEASQTVLIGDQLVKDVRRFDTGIGYSLDYLASQVAVLRSGVAVLLSTRDREDGARKWTLAGHASPECVEAFIAEWAPAQGLVGIYGAPSRGYAGGYVVRSIAPTEKGTVDV